MFLFYKNESKDDDIQLIKMSDKENGDLFLCFMTAILASQSILCIHFMLLVTETNSGELLSISLKQFQERSYVLSASVIQATVDELSGADPLKRHLHSFIIDFQL